MASNPNPSSSPSSSATRDPYPAPGPAPSPTDVTALLLEVLRNVNREVKTTLDLSGRAQAAVDHFRAISVSLRTLADGSAFFNASTGTAAGTTPTPRPR
ncbi:MAG TPA: hypothetical protein VGO02_02180 [Burkholderiales bacterium]|jgi:hypothetical protein|nr:hypothetical protein [Burkholderiales bacterium]